VTENAQDKNGAPFIDERSEPVSFFARFLSPIHPAFWRKPELPEPGVRQWCRKPGDTESASKTGAAEDNMIW